jgi:hypothetical protein
MAGANIHIGIIAGKLNGVIPAVTPRVMHGINVDALLPRQYSPSATRAHRCNTDNFKATLNVAFGIRNSFEGASKGQRFSLFVHVAVQQATRRPSTHARGAVGSWLPICHGGGGQTA